MSWCKQARTHLARVEAWPSWAKHIKSVTLTPPGILTDASESQFRLKGGADRARLTWIVEAEGFGSRTIGRVFGAIYARNLDRAIPDLRAELPAGP